MTFPQSLVIVSALLLLWGGYAYLRDTLAGRTKPNRVTWFLWALAPLVSFGAAFSADADNWASVRVLVGGVVPAVIFLGSFVNKTAIGDSPGLIGFAGAYLWQHYYSGSS